MKYVPLVIILFIFCSVNSCSKKDIIKDIDKNTVIEEQDETRPQEIIETSIEDDDIKDDIKDDLYYTLNTGIYEIHRDFRRSWIIFENVHMYKRIGDILLLRYNTMNKYMLYDYIQKSYYELPFHELQEVIFISPREIRMTGYNYHNFTKITTDITMNITFNDSDRKNNSIGQNIMEMKTENKSIYYGGARYKDYSDLYTVEIFGKKALFDLSNIPVQSSNYTNFGIQFDPLHDVYTITADRNGSLER